MKIALNLFHHREPSQVLISKELPQKIAGEISKFKDEMAADSILKYGKTFLFAPHHSPKGNIDCVLVNHGAYTRTLSLDANKEEVLETIRDLAYRIRIRNQVK